MRGTRFMSLFSSTGPSNLAYKRNTVSANTLYIILYTCLFKLHGFDHMCQLERYMQITGRQGNWAGSNCLRIFVSDSCILSSEKHWAQYCVGTRQREQRYHQHCLTHLEVHLAETRRYIPLGSEMAALSSVLSHPYHPRPSL